MEHPGKRHMASPEAASGTGVSNQLASLVPSFDPATDDLLVFQQKVQLVTTAWPKNRLTELITRLILGCKGTAFQKLELHQEELLSGDGEEAIKKLIGYLGGAWGKIPLERQYEDAEQALYHTVQRQDEANDSYLARADVLWSRLLARKMTMSDLQAYVVLRGSQLSSDEKKKVILDSEKTGTLTMTKVHEAIRILGASFFQDMTGKKVQRTKIYDNAVLMTETTSTTEGHAEGETAPDEVSEQDFIDSLASDGDPDALLIADFEAAAMDTIQEDHELATAFSAYQQARHKLAEKFRNRGFFPAKPFKGKGYGYKGGKGNASYGTGGGRRTLQDRILNSNCRICGQRGHWRSECPMKDQARSSGSSANTATAPTTTVVAMSDISSLPLEFVGLPETVIDEPKPILATSFVCVPQKSPRRYSYRGKILREFNQNDYTRGPGFMDCETTARERLRHRLRNEANHRPLNTEEDRNQSDFVDANSSSVSKKPDMSPDAQVSHPLVMPLPTTTMDTHHDPLCFATHDSFGVLDLGASKTVIGSNHVACLIRSLDEDVRAQLSRCPCQITFKFASQGTLTSQQALVVPVGKLKLKIAIVPGGTPFLISNTFMRAIRAQIDCFAHRLISPQLNKDVPLELTEKGLFLINLNDIIKAAAASQGGRTPPTKIVQETFVTAPEENTEEDLMKPKGQQNTSDSKHDNPKRMVSFADDMPQPNAVVPKSDIRKIHSSVEFSETPVQSPDSEVPPERDSSCHGLVAQSPEEPPGGDASGVDRSQWPDVRRTGQREGQLRTEAYGRHLRDGMGGSAVDQLYGLQVRIEQGAEPPPPDPLCRAQGGGTREDTASDSLAATARVPSWIHRRDRRPFWQQIHPAQGEGSSSCHVKGASYSTGWRRRDGIRDVQLGDYGPAATESGPGFLSHAAKNAEHGGCSHQGDSSPGGQSWRPDSALNSSDAELISHDCDPIHHDVADLRNLIQKFSKELETISQCHRPMGKPYLLGEVFCSRESPLTQQVQNLGHQAFRHGLEQGDLATTEGRANLFQSLCRHVPQHVWYSPVCGPWSSWSALNASRSVEHQAKYQQLRHEHRYQIALGIVLYRHQISKGLHFHWEQPQRSLMMLHPGLNELHQHTQSCQFDMCRVGNLVDPETKIPMKKGMQLLTTHEPIFRALHGRTCSGEHVHQPIEGSTRCQGSTILRTQYTEVYPRKFARLIAKTMKQSRHTWPFQWQHGMLFTGTTQEVPVLAGRTTSVLKPSAIRSRANFARSQLLTPSTDSEGTVKRRRLNGKQSAPVDLELCQSLFQDLQTILPRVGRREIDNQDVIHKLQHVFPDKRIVTAIACRGTDRTLGPPEHLQRDLAPYRRTIMILRPSGSIQYEKEWEKWDNLSHRQLVRPAHACRINCTVFAQNRPEENNPKRAPIIPSDSPEDLSTHGSHDGSSEQPSSSSRSAEPVDHEQPLPTQTPTECPASSEPAPRDSETCPDDTMSPMSDQVPQSEITRQEQTSQFKALPKWEQSQLLLMHRNLGHPSNERLAKALQANGQRPEMVRAAAELRCSVCAANAAPKHQRPSHLKELLDFNYRIYLDGIKWTNRAGESFQIYHIVDAGTQFHVAFIAPAHTSKDVISLIHQQWINWAGSPQELRVDSGTELNSEEFSQFAQRMSIRCTTTCPEAHWQNGTIERHGSFLQHMLSKVDLEMPIKNYRELQVALNQCTQAKNSMVVHRGYSPEIMVFGKQSRLPGSVLSDLSIPAHTAALQEESEMSADSFKQQLKVRELARQAFHTADNSDALRRSYLRRSCPSRGHYQKGQWVMIWCTVGPQSKGWIGPQRVIVQDGSHTVWTTVGGRLYRSAPENIRLALPEEGQPMGPDLPEDLTEIQQQINRMTIDQSMPSIPEEETLIPNNEDTSPPTPAMVPTNHNPSISRETSAQPDQEPEVNSHQESINDPEVSEGTEELLYYTCHDEACALMETETTQYAWKCEFEINTPEEFVGQEPDPEDAWVLLATQSKKQRSEVRFSELTESERREFAIAKQAEVNNWLKTETLTKMFRDQVPHDQILKCRWILNWKPLDPTDVTANQGRSHKAKARIVVLGYMDPQIEDIPRDSPTLSRSSRIVILQLIASHAWKLQSFDIKAAFLQGQPQENRLIAVDPVSELRDALNLTPNEITRLNKSAYGLIDAPYLWYCALVQELTRLGMEACPFDPCVFILREDSIIPEGNGPAPKRQSPAQGAIVGILGVHVDDGIGGGNEKFQQVLQKLEAKFAFGSKKTSAFTFTGIDVAQHGDHSISLSQSNYVRKISPIPIDSTKNST